MSQVGFRDEMHKGTSETEHQTPPPTVKPPDIPHMRQPPPRPGENYILNLLCLKTYYTIVQT